MKKQQDNKTEGQKQGLKFSFLNTCDVLLLQYKHKTQTRQPKKVVLLSCCLSCCYKTLLNLEPLRK